MALFARTLHQLHVRSPEARRRERHLLLVLHDASAQRFRVGFTSRPRNEQQTEQAHTGQAHTEQALAA